MPLLVASILLAVQVLRGNPVGVLLIAILVVGTVMELLQLYRPLSKKELAREERPLRKPSTDPNNPDVTPRESRRLGGYLVTPSALFAVDTGVFQTWKGTSSVLASLLALPAFVVGAMLLGLIMWACQAKL